MKPKVLESRERADGFRYRKYEADGVKFTTIEVPLAMWNRLAWKGKQRYTLLRHQKFLSRQARQLRAKEMLRSGVPPPEVAKTVRANLRTVYRWRQQLKGEAYEPSE